MSFVMYLIYILFVIYHIYVYICQSHIILVSLTKSLTLLMQQLVNRVRYYLLDKSNILPYELMFI